MLNIIKKHKKLSSFFIIFFIIIIFPIITVYSIVTQPLLSNYQFPETTLFSALPESSATTLKQHVKFLSEHDRTTPTNQKYIIDYIINNLISNGIEEKAIELQKYSIGNDSYHNIIVHYGKTTTASTTEKKYVIGAHYDTYSHLPNFFPGADDNASGVAGLLEIANMLKQISITDRAIDIVFYSTEEPPFFRTSSMGSYQHAKNAKDTDLAIILEMIGYFSEQNNSQQFPISVMKYLYSSTGNFIAIVSDINNISQTRAVKKRFRTNLAQKNLIDVESVNAPSHIAGIDFSDHLNYWKFNIPAVMITDTSFYRNKNYHTINDTYEKLDYHKMKAVVDATVAMVLSL